MRHSLIVGFIGCMLLGVGCSDDTSDVAGPKPGVTNKGGECVTDERFFAREVWAQTLKDKCLGCHNPQGLASATSFVLRDSVGQPDAMASNFEALKSVATRFASDDERPLVLRKPIGELAHAGGTIIKRDDVHYQRLEEFVARLAEPVTECPDGDIDFMAGVELESPYRTLRHFALNFASRLPSADEIARVDADGEKALAEIIDEMMMEKAFGERIAEGFNDVFLTDGARFEIAMLGTVNHPDLLWFLPLPQPDKSIALDSTVYGVNRAVNRLIQNIVMEEEPFSNILLADYTMVNPFSARSLGVFDAIQWQDPDDEDEFHTVKLKFGPSEEDYPHAGVLNNYIYLNRNPSTPTNVNRGRARAFLLNFLGVDILKFSPVLSDPLATMAAYDNPIRDANDCAICHVAIDPIAGVFHNYQSRAARYPGPVPENTFPAGFELTSDDDSTVAIGDREWSGGMMPEARDFDSLLWLGERAVADPRFSSTMVKHFFNLVIGRPVLEAPLGLPSAERDGAFRAFEEQQAALEVLRADFVASNYDAKKLVKAMVLSPYFRARTQTETSAEVDYMRYDLGAAQLLTPEQLHRKIVAIFGDSFQTFPAYKDALLEFSKYRILYGGIDSTEVVTRILEPNGIMAGIQQLIANNVSCRQASREFDRPAGERLLLGNVELGTFAASDEAAIRDALVHIHERILGERLSPSDEAINISYELFRQVQSEGAAEIAANTVPEDLRRACEAGNITQDPDFVVRAWAAVFNYQMQSFEFLYH